MQMKWDGFQSSKCANKHKWNDQKVVCALHALLRNKYDKFDSKSKPLNAEMFVLLWKKAVWVDKKSYFFLTKIIFKQQQELIKAIL